MAQTESLPVYKAAYDLLVTTYRRMPGMPREIRYTLLEQMHTQQIELLTLICKANATREKLPLIRLARDTLLEIRIRMRLLNDLKHIPMKLYADMCLQTENISKQLTAWEKSFRNVE